MAIAWRRGFFRIWVLLALVWICGTGLVFWQVYSTRGLDDTYAFIEGQGDVAWKYSSPVYQGALAAQKLSLMQEIISKDTPSLTVFVQTRADNNFWDVVQHYDPLRVGFYQAHVGAARQVIAVWGLAFALGVPLALLLAGWAIGWAISGFRRTAAH